MGLPVKGYGLWGTVDLWVMVCISLPTKLVDGWGYGIKGVMGYQEYGLRGVQLYRDYVEIFTKISCLHLYWLVKISLQYFSKFLFAKKKCELQFYKKNFEKSNFKKLLKWRVL